MKPVGVTSESYVIEAMRSGARLKVGPFSRLIFENGSTVDVYHETAKAVVNRVYLRGLVSPIDSDRWYTEYVLRDVMA
jgi:hypothetical protein